MLRLRVIEQQIAEHEEQLAEAWRALGEECGDDPEEFAHRWHAVVCAWPFAEVNDLVDRHNRWYPIESRLPMDPQTGDYALVNGRDYRLLPLDAEWVLERFPATRERVQATR